MWNVNGARAVLQHIYFCSSRTSYNATHSIAFWYSVVDSWAIHFCASHLRYGLYPACWHTKQQWKLFITFYGTLRMLSGCVYILKATCTSSLLPSFLRLFFFFVVFFHIFHNIQFYLHYINSQSIAYVSYLFNFNSVYLSYKRQKKKKKKKRKQFYFQFAISICFIRSVCQFNSMECTISDFFLRWKKRRKKKKLKKYDEISIEWLCVIFGRSLIKLCVRFCTQSDLLSNKCHCVHHRSTMVRGIWPIYLIRRLSHRKKSIRNDLQMNSVSKRQPCQMPYGL